MKHKHAKAISKLIDEKLETASNHELNDSDRKAALNEALTTIERTDALNKDAKTTAIKTVDTIVGVAGAMTAAAGIWVKLCELDQNEHLKKMEMAFRARMTDAVMRFEEDHIAGNLITKQWLDFVTKFK